MEENKACCSTGTIDRYLRGIAGAFLALSVLMYHVHSPQWIWFVLFIGLNLFQSAFTKWCPMIFFLQKLGIKD